jgi:predicted transcriptional regulator
MKSKGLGDTIKKVTVTTKLDRIVEQIAKKLTNSNDCGCDERQKTLNKLFPYK